MVPVGNLEGIGAKMQERLVEDDINTVQQLAKASVDVEQLTKLDGIGQKTAKNLIERAKAFVSELELQRAEEKRLREEAEAAREVEESGKSIEEADSGEPDSDDKKTDEKTDHKGETVIEKMEDN